MPLHCTYQWASSALPAPNKQPISLLHSRATAPGLWPGTLSAPHLKAFLYSSSLPERKMLSWAMRTNSSKLRGRRVGQGMGGS